MHKLKIKYNYEQLFETRPSGGYEALQVDNMACGTRIENKTFVHAAAYGLLLQILEHEAGYTAPIWH